MTPTGFHFLYRMLWKKFEPVKGRVSQDLFYSAPPGPVRDVLGPFRMSSIFRGVIRNRLSGVLDTG